MEMPPRKYQILLLGLIAIGIFLRIDENPDLTLSQKILSTGVVLFFVLLGLLPVYLILGLKQSGRI